MPNPPPFSVIPAKAGIHVHPRRATLCRGRGIHASLRLSVNPLCPPLLGEEQKELGDTPRPSAGMSPPAPLSSLSQHCRVGSRRMPNPPTLSPWPSRPLPLAPSREGREIPTSRRSLRWETRYVGPQGASILRSGGERIADTANRQETSLCTSFILHPS